MPWRASIQPLQWRWEMFFLSPLVCGRWSLCLLGSKVLNSVFYFRILLFSECLDWILLGPVSSQFITILEGKVPDYRAVVVEDGQAISKSPCASVSKWTLNAQNLSYKNESDLHANEILARTHLHMNGFTQSLLAERPIIQWKTCIQYICQITNNSFNVAEHLGFRFILVQRIVGLAHCLLQ